MITSSTTPGPTSSTWKRPPEPPPITDIVSEVVFKEPSLVITLVPGIPVMVALIK